MIVTLDGRRLTKPFLPERTLQSLVDEVRREHLGSRIVVEVALDGRPLLDPALSESLPQPLGPVQQIDLVSGDARELVAAALRETAEQLDLAAGAHIEIAGDIQAGHAADAIRQYSELLPLWHACRSSVQNAGAILGVDFHDFRHDGRSLMQWFEELAARLRDVRDAFESRDYVMLSDALKYEMPQVCQSWQSLLIELAAYVGRVDDAPADELTRRGLADYHLAGDAAVRPTDRKPTMTRMSLIAFAAFAAAATASAADRIDLRVTRVAVFSSGVAYFECEAAVRDVASAELSFRTAQINDILKSLIVQDLSGGSVGVVSYASQDPIEKTLKSFGVDLTSRPTLGQLLDQLRGEPVEISGARSVKGVIVGVEKHKIADEKGIVEFDVLNVLTEAGIQQLRVSELTGVKLTNEKVDAELRKALVTLATAHDADKRTITLNFTGQGERKVRVAYLLEAPIWKTTYRLSLDEAGKPFLQGWATVENATEEDWRDVRLSLVSGRPISFTMDLYTPIYIPRPREELELYASLRPPNYAGAIEDKVEKPAGCGRRGDQLRMAARDRNAAAEAPEMESLAKSAMPAAAPAPATLRDSGVESVAAAQEAGELFEYAIKSPVSVGRQHSAMLPIVNQEIAGEKLSIYNPVTHAKHPLHGLRITNSTDLNLMQGPVTVFDGQVYAGDAKLPDLKPNEQRLIAYALDLGVEVTVEAASHPEQITSLRIAKGTLVYKNKFVDERNYSIKNKDRKDRTVILEQSHSDDWKLVEPKEAFEKTAGLSRFKVAAPAEKTTAQKTVFEQVLEQTVLIAPLNIDQIRIFLSARTISQPVKAALERVIQMKTELDGVARQRAEKERESNEAVAEQARIRENLKTLQSGSDQHRRQEQKFGEVDQRIDNLRTQIAELRSTEEQRRKALEAYVLSIDAE